jgi:hypothetical protein
MANMGAEFYPEIGVLTLAPFVFVTDDVVEPHREPHFLIPRFRTLTCVHKLRAHVQANSRYFTRLQ